MPETKPRWKVQFNKWVWVAGLFALISFTCAESRRELPAILSLVGALFCAEQSGMYIEREQRDAD